MRKLFSAFYLSNAIICDYVKITLIAERHVLNKKSKKLVSNDLNLTNCVRI